jgi:hypothetical protein
MHVAGASAVMMMAKDGCQPAAVLVHLAELCLQRRDRVDCLCVDLGMEIRLRGRAAAMLLLTKQMFGRSRVQ